MSWGLKRFHHSGQTHFVIFCCYHRAHLFLTDDSRQTFEEGLERTRQGRWMSPDPYAGSYDFTNPQSFNRYSYVMNDPLSSVDPLGLELEQICATVPDSGYFESDFTVYIYAYPDNCEFIELGDFDNSPPPPMPVPRQVTVGPQTNPNNATNNGLLTPKQQQCAERALKKNAVALSFDAAGIGAGFLPGGDLVVAGAQGAVSVASGINSAVHGDAVGSTFGILGLPASFAGASAKFFGVGAKAIPGLGTAISAFGALNDAYSTYQDYQACLAGH